MSSKIQTTSLTDGLVAYFPFNGNANDESGNNHITTINGATLTTDRFDNANQAYHFTTSSNIQIQSSALLEMQTSDYTITAWVKFEKISNMRIYTHGSAYCTVAGYQFRTTSTLKLHQEYTCSSGGCPLRQDGLTELSIGQWYFVANTVQRTGQAIIYINAVVDNIASNFGSCNIYYGENAYIGRYPPEPEYAFYGDIDEVRIYSRALTNNEIQQLYNENNPTLIPTSSPTQKPTFFPTKNPTLIPTSSPTQGPTFFPTKNPTLMPTTFYTNVEVATPNYVGTEKNENFIINIATNNIITGGGGCDKYTFFSHSGTTTAITGFSKDCSVIDLEKVTDVNTIDDLSITYGSSGTTISLPNDQQIVLQALDTADITEGNFIFSAYRSPEPDSTDGTSGKSHPIPSWVLPAIVTICGTAVVGAVGFLIRYHFYQGYNVVNHAPIGIALVDKEIELIKYELSTTKFDYYNNNNPVKTSWVSSNDAILVYDHNDNKRVDFAKEIVLTEWRADAKTDFEALLCNFDSNKDKVFNKEDQEFSKFYLWQDKNQDGFSQDGELTSLQEAGIIAIDFNTQEEIEGNLRELGALNKAEILWADGRVTYAYDLVFTHDDVV